MGQAYTTAIKNPRTGPNGWYAAVLRPSVTFLEKSADYEFGTILSRNVMNVYLW